MPTTIYTDKPIGSVSHAGKQYDVVKGEVSVPDDAVPALCESHGFTREPKTGGAEESAAFDFGALTKNQLIEMGVNFGAELKSNMTKDEVTAIVKPLWEADQAKKAA